MEAVSSGATTITDYHGPALEYEDLERVQSSNPNDPPRYRERDPNAGLPMRGLATSSAAAGPSGTQTSRRRVGGGFTEDELEAEPPQFAMMRRRSSAAQESGERQEEEDYGEGTSGSTA